MISAVILTKNEEKNIEACLNSLKWCDEIIIIDDCSEDGTVKKINNERDRAFGERSLLSQSEIKIFERHLAGDFAAQRNFGLEKATGEWILFVDADERVTEQLREEILKQVQNDKQQNLSGFYIKRKDFLFSRGLNHGETGNIRFLRLAKKGSGRWTRAVHETWQVRGEILELDNPLLHYPHQTIKEFLEDINFYTDLNAQTFYKQGVRAGSLEILFYPAAKFIRNYFLKLGFLDGLPGLLSAILMSFHSFLTRAKFWQLQNENN